MIISPAQIRMAVALLGLNTTKAAKALGVSRSTLSYIMNMDLKEGDKPKHNPNTDSVSKIRANLSLILERNGYSLISTEGITQLVSSTEMVE